MLARNAHDGVQVAHLIRHVDWDDGFGVPGDLPFDVGRINHQALIHFRKHRHRAHGQDCNRRGHPGEGRHDDLVAGPEPQADQRANERTGTAVDGERVFDADLLAQVFLEPINVSILAAAVPHKLPAGDNLGDFLDFLLAHHVHDFISWCLV